MYIICTFERGNSEFINKGTRLFTLNLLQGSNATPIYTQEEADGEDIWYKEFNQSHIAVVFKIKREAMEKEYFNGFFVRVENKTSSGSDGYRCAERNFYFSTTRARSTLYFTGGMVDYDIQKGNEVVFYNNQIKKILKYGANVKVYAEETNNNN
jgi:hypothetical protein